MAERSLKLALLSLTLVLPGCLGIMEEDDEDIAATALRVAPVVRSAEEFDLPGGGQSEMGLNVPAGTGAIFISYRAHVAGPRGDLALVVTDPEGTRFGLAELAARLVPADDEGWSILRPIPGAWRVTANANNDAHGLVDISALPPRDAPVPIDEGNFTGGADHVVVRRSADQGQDAPQRVVVAVVDTGVNPYHEVFQRAGLATATLPEGIRNGTERPLPIALRRSFEYVESVRVDAPLWLQVPAQRLVHFENTNLLGYHLDPVEAPLLPVLDRAGHGTAVASAITREDPEALVVMITGENWDDGVRWAAAQPWIDVISLSWGPPANVLGVANGSPLFTYDTMAATREAWAAGKVVFTASGNDPTPTFTDTTSGPPWVHAVSGSQAETRSRALLSGNLVDTVANWTQELASYDSLDEMRVGSGTSFATPTTAGIASRIVHDLRVRTGHVGGITDGALVLAPSLNVTNGRLRDALNASAVWWDTGDYLGPSQMGIPVLPAPWMSMGWGHVDGSVVRGAVRGILGLAPEPEKPEAAHEWMDGNLELRKVWWEQRMG